MANKPHYYVRYDKSFDTLVDARVYLNSLPFTKVLEIGYHIPQPQYKSWVPKFIIKLITKQKT